MPSSAVYDFAIKGYRGDLITMFRISKSTLGVLTLTQVVLSSTTVFGQEKPTPGLPAPVPETAGGPSIAAGITGGTLGIGAEASYLITPYFVARASVTDLKFRYDSLLSELGLSSQYDFTLSEFTAGALLDFHPFQNGFRVVGGARYADFNFVQSKSYASDYVYSINGKPYTTAQIGALSTAVNVRNQVAPYIGFGWDSVHYFSSIRAPDASWVGEKFTVGFDLGALYTGGVKVNMTTDEPVPGSSLPHDLATESQHLAKTLNKIYFFYPVAMTTFKYRF
jgi:hypothetical protein